MPRESHDTGAHAVDVRGLRIRYGDAEVVRGFDLSVRSGEIVSLLGPSGCGKTTTLRAIAGFVAPESGDIRLGGRSVTAIPPHRRDVGMVFQGYALFPHLSVFDNVAYGLRMRRVPQHAIAERVKSVLSLVKLGDYGDRRPRHLSGGQQQRVAIARALVIEPRVLLLDEPLSNLDAKLRQEMRIEMRHLLRSTNVASIFVTHDQEEAMVISDRIVLMNEGVIVQEGTPREIYQHPESLFAAAFVGRANFLHGTVVETRDSGEAIAVIENTRFRGIACGHVRPGMSVTMVVKHERIRSLPIDAATSGNAADCVLESLSFIGASIEAHCVFGKQPIVSLVSALSQAVPEPAPGTRLRLVWEEADALIFPDGPA